MSYLVGIDLGSTSLKAVIFDQGGNVVARASRPTVRHNPYPDHPQWAIWKPDEIWDGVAASLREAVGQLDDPRLISGVAVTGMGMDGVPIDAEGRWLYPFISWHCPRTEPQMRWWLDHIGAEKQFAISGNQIWVFNTAFRLLWMAENEPDILRRTHKWLLIEDFVNFMLCGRCATDYTMASSTLLFDQRQRDWSEELLTRAGIKRSLLCDPFPSGTLLGKVHGRAAEATGLPEGTQVVLGGHDFLCGALAVGVFRPGLALNVTGTWEVVTAATPQPVLAEELGRTGIWVDSHVAKNVWTLVGATVSADQLEWFRREYAQEEKMRAATEGGTDWDYLMEAAVASPLGANGVMFLPHMSGCYYPTVDHRSMGAFVGLRNTVTKGDMLRAMIEGLGYQFLQMVNGFAAAGVYPERIIATGGGTQNQFMMQNKADVLGRPVETPQAEEAVPLGAAILAGIGTGIYRDEQDAVSQVYKPGRVYEPEPEITAKYAERFKIFQEIYPALKNLNESLVSC